MGRTGEVDGGRVFAWLFVLGAHLAFWWVLTRKVALPEPVDDTDEALQLTWIEPPKPSLTPDATATAAPDDRRPAPAPVRKPPVRAKTPPEATPAVAPVPDRALSAVFIEQARQLSGTRAGGDTSFAPDPLAHRRAKLPGTGDDRFRMRAPPSIRGALLRIGAMAGGPGYTTDPCPRVAGNIDALSQLGDSELLQEELRRKRELCD
jgi:hypothetical protein